jgi:hypothetical protein
MIQKEARNGKRVLNRNVQHMNKYEEQQEKALMKRRSEI